MLIIPSTGFYKAATSFNKSLNCFNMKIPIFQIAQKSLQKISKHLN